MTPQCTPDDREAYFGAWRIIADGADIRGFYHQSSAEDLAAKLRGKSYYSNVVVKDNRSSCDRYLDEVSRLPDGGRWHSVYGDLGSIPL